MTPKEKAEQLVSQYEICTRPLFALGDYENEKHYNKQCALIAVDETLYTLENDIESQYINWQVWDELIIYWQTVRQIIEKL